MINVIRYVVKKTGKELSSTMFALFCAEFGIASLSLLTSYSVAMAQVDVDDVLSRASNKSVVRDSRVDTSTLDVMQQATGDAISKAKSIDEGHERYRKDIEATATWITLKRIPKNAWWNEGGVRMACQTGRKAGEEFDVFVNKNGWWTAPGSAVGGEDVPDKLAKRICE